MNIKDSLYRPPLSLLFRFFICSLSLCSSLIIGCTPEATPTVEIPLIDDLSISTFDSFDQGVANSDFDAGMSTPRKPFGEECDDNQECESLFCVRGEEGIGGVCSRLCLGADCPSGWGCRAVANLGADVAFVCLPDVARLCRPCSQNIDCPLGKCIEIDGKSVCGSSCESDDECESGYICQEDPIVLGDDVDIDMTEPEPSGQCVPQTLACDCQIEEQVGVRRLCDRSNDFGQCLGKQICEGEQGWSECDAAEPEEELCDGIDNNCNGIPDDFPNLGQECQSQGEIDGEVVMCTGYLTCLPQSLNLSCSAPPPQAELCNFKDDDCDGTSDEDFPELDELCTVGQGVCQRTSRYRCSEDQTSIICDLQEGEPEEERCDGLDNDCDGYIDEGPPRIENLHPPLSQTCYGGNPEEIGQGQCQAGTQTCEGGQWSQCVGEQRGAVEQCNQADDDCDGNIDEESIGTGNLCNTGLAGICAQGQIQCETGGLVCRQNQFGLADDRICDQLDDDCDGVADEDVPLLGTGCIDGVGPCASAGAYQCDPTDVNQVICSGQADLSRATPEECNYVDDDCDGEADESFTNEQGQRALIEHCGGCGISCISFWPEGPESYNVAPLCQATQGVYSCGFECLEGAFDLDGIESNGCEFVPDPFALYVSTPGNGGQDQEGCGEALSPCASIQFALNQGSLQPEIERIRVSDGLYRESINLVSGISVLGGHSAINWVRLPEVYVSVISGIRQEGQIHQYTLSAVDLSPIPLEISGFTLVGPNGSLGGNSYGIYLLNMGDQIQIKDNVIVAGNGGQGPSGISGVSGAVGVNGSVGNNTRNVRCSGSGVQNVGGNGGRRSCQDPETFGNGLPTFTSVDGGNGGAAICPNVNRQEGSGIAGLDGGGTGGEGGPGGWGHRVNSGCSPTPGEPETGTDGYPGVVLNTHDGIGGQGCGLTQGRLVDGHWQANTGNAGNHGRHGSGGGGGGAGGGQYLAYNNTRDIGGSGGGGGSGGCAAGGGQGGQGAGGSFGIWIAWSNEAQALPILLNNRISRGTGGNGGSGGNGGAGGEAGVGGNGGQLDDYDGPIYCVFPGANGGLGARGGHGGGGGGACGGISYEIAVFGLNGLLPTYEESNLLLIDEGSETSGIGGDGGTSNNTERGLGEAGEAGAYGNILYVD